MVNRISNYILFFVVVSLVLLDTIIVKYELKIDELIFNFYSEKLTNDQLYNLMNTRDRWYWISYATIPIVILIRISLVALCLSVGNFFYEMEEKIPFKKYFRVALMGEFILLLVGYFKFGYFYFIKTDYTLEDLQQYYPLSYINFLDLEKVEPLLHYPLQTINLFEITYFFVLVYGMHKLLKNKYSKDLEITAVSYGSGLLIWMGFVMFLTLNYT